jgi:hypothetical protein
VECEGTPAAGLTKFLFRKALSDILALKPYWGKLAVRNLRGGDGDVGIIRNPVRAIALLDLTAGRNFDYRIIAEGAGCRVCSAK